MYFLNKRFWWIVAAFASIFHYVGQGTKILQIAP